MQKESNIFVGIFVKCNISPDLQILGNLPTFGLPRGFNWKDHQLVQHTTSFNVTFVTIFCFVKSENMFYYINRRLMPILKQNLKVWRKISTKISKLCESIITRGSVYEAFCIGTLAWGATWDPFFRKKMFDFWEIVVPIFEKNTKFDLKWI